MWESKEKNTLSCSYSINLEMEPEEEQMNLCCCYLKAMTSKKLAMNSRCYLEEGTGGEV